MGDGCSLRGAAARLCAVGLAIAVVAGCGGSENEDASAPGAEEARTTVSALLDALKRGEAEEACEILSPASHDDLVDIAGTGLEGGCVSVLKRFPRLMRDGIAIDPATIKVGEASVEGEEATVAFSGAAEDRVELREFRGSWQVVSPGFLFGGREVQPPSPSDPEVPLVAVLAPVDGGGGSGRVTLPAEAGEPTATFTAREVAPTRPGEVYVFWTFSKVIGAFPLAQDELPGGGTLRGKVKVPGPLRTVIGDYSEVRLTRASAAQVDTELERVRQGGGLPRLVGEVVLTGPIKAAPPPTG